MSKIRTQINLPKSWILEHKIHFDLESLSAPIDYVCDEFLKNKKIAPTPQNIFKAFELCAYQETKVVIFGQDPYFQEGLANGLAFSGIKDQPIPASLKNIYKEIKNDMANNSKVIVPSVFDDFSSKNVLTMEYLPGIKVTNVEALDKKNIDRQQLVIDVHQIFFTMLLKHSIFHADPHPGNISVTDEGKLILYDYGMVGRINNKTRINLIRLYLALVEKNPSRVVSAMDDLKMLTPDYNRSVIEKGIELSIRSMHGDKPDEMEVESLMELANKTMSKFPFILPKNLALYLRMASIIEGIYKTHDVDFKFLKVLKNILQQENLITGAYVEELKISFDSFLKSINSTLRVGSDMEKLMNEVEVYMKKRKPVVLISGSIFSSAIFIGSVLLFQSNEYFGTIGMISSGIIMGISALLRKY